MKIAIDDRREIHAIQEEFEKLFPSLRLEFYKKASKEGIIRPDEIIESDSRTLGDCRTVHKKGTVNITPFMTVSELKDMFRNEYGLTIKVFHKVGKGWVEVDGVGNRTLSEQNRW